MADNRMMIHVENLKKDFGKLEVLKDISIDIETGEVVVLLGPSGSGKSTFLRCINQLEHATSGTIVVDDFGTEIGTSLFKRKTCRHAWGRAKSKIY